MGSLLPFVDSGGKTSFTAITRVRVGVCSSASGDSNEPITATKK